MESRIRQLEGEVASLKKKVMLLIIAVVAIAARVGMEVAL